MPSLKIYINPYSGENSFYKNCGRIGSKSHSPFRNLTTSSIFGWIRKLPLLAGNEMNDKYDLVVTAPEFEAILIKLVMKDQPLCSSFTEEDFEVSWSAKERLDKARKLMEKYGGGHDVTFRSSMISEFNKEDITHIKLDNLDFEIVDDFKEFVDFKSNGIIWHTSNSEKVFRIIHNRFEDIPVLIDICNSLNNFKGQMSDDDKDIFDSLLLTSPQISPSIDNEIEVGKSSEIKIKIVPEGIQCPNLRITVDNPIFVISGNTITAKEVGHGTISISREDNPEEALSVAVKSFSHNNVTAVHIAASKSVMECGCEQNLSVSAEPFDAEDVDKLSVISENPKVIEIINGNIVRAVGPGKGTITASCNKCSAQIQIEVLPKLESIKLDINENQEYRVGESIVAKLLLTPSNAYLHHVSLKSSDTTVISIEDYIENEYRLKARSIGDCEIVVSDENGSVLSKQHIHVISTLYKKKKPSYTAFIALAALLSSIFVSFHPFPGDDYVLVILMIIALFLSLWSIFKKKRHYFTSVIVAGIVIWALSYAVKDYIQENRSKNEIIEQSQSEIDNGNRK